MGRAMVYLVLMLVVSFPSIAGEDYLKQGDVLFKLDRYEEAIACFDKALKLDPKYALAWNLKGLALFMLGRYEEAIKSCEKALEIDPKYVRAWDGKGEALGKLGRHKEAATCFDKATGE